MLERIFTQIRYRFFYYSSKSAPGQPQADHIRQALEWFRNSLLPEGGASAKYSMMTHGFAPGYPMSTANWVPVLTRIHQHYPHVYEQVFGTDDISKELVNWILRTQRRDGTFPGSFGDFMNQPPVVFNNGMIIHGLLDYYNASGKKELIDSCINSAEWLLKVQSPDGSWRQFTFHQLSSNTLTASALLRLANITHDSRYRESAIRNIEFALELQSDNGFFSGNGFDISDRAYTMTIGYALAGIMEAAVLENNQLWLNAAMKGLVPVMNRVNNHGFLVGEFNEHFHSSASYSCLPGSSLLAICAYKMASITGSEELKSKAELLTNYVKSKQMSSSIPGIAGGISGSFPISGDYCSYEITSWGVRYFIEALMLQDDVK
jgi:hypothetical protein